MTLLWSKEADADTTEIWLYSLEKWGPVVASEYMDRIADIAEALAAGDLSGTDESRIRSGFRRQVVASHALWFQIRGADIVIMRVLHQSRDAWRLLEE